MKRILIFTLLGTAFAAFENYSNTHPDLAVLDGRPDYELTMYSLTTCGFCKQKAAQLREENIAFEEYFIDQDEAKEAELTAKLEAAGYSPAGFGTPIFVANGTVLPNNPSVALIKSTLRETLSAR